MNVSSYQMHNVLNVYAKRLERSAETRHRASAETTHPSATIQLSAEGKRRSVIDKVAATIANRIARFGPQNEVDAQILQKLNDEMADKPMSRKSKREPEFLFNRIDANSEKRTDSLRVDDEEFLFKRLEQLARETVDSQMVSNRNAEDASQE